MEASMKVELDVNHNIDSVDLVDQLVKARLAWMKENLQQWGDAPNVVTACKILLDWMETPDE